MPRACLHNPGSAEAESIALLVCSPVSLWGVPRAPSLEM